MSAQSQAAFWFSNNPPAEVDPADRPPRIIAVGEGWAFWRIRGDDVYRAPVGAELDTWGHPMGKRWECGYSHWLHYRAVYDWAVDA